MPTEQEVEAREEINALRQVQESAGWQRVREEITKRRKADLTALATATMLPNEEAVQNYVRHKARADAFAEVLDMPRMLEAKRAGGN